MLIKHGFFTFKMAYGIKNKPVFKDFDENRFVILYYLTENLP